MKETFYFSHDYHAREDEKIMRLVAKNGWEAYGLFWAIVEKLYEEGGILEKDYDSLAFALRTDSERIANVIESGLFEFRNDKFYSKSVNARLVKRKGKSEMARQSANLRWSKQKIENTNAMRTQCERNAIKESKVKESKVNLISEETSQTNKNISEVIKMFEIVNPSYEKFYGNKTQRSVCERLLKKWSIPQIRVIVNLLPEFNAKEYQKGKSITPLQMEDNLAYIKTFIDSKRQVNSKIAIIS